MKVNNYTCSICSEFTSHDEWAKPQVACINCGIEEQNLSPDPTWDSKGLNAGCHGLPLKLGREIKKFQSPKPRRIWGQVVRNASNKINLGATWPKQQATSLPQLKTKIKL